MAQQNYTRHDLPDTARALRANPGIIFGAIIVTALLAFEIFNYGTTDYALRDLLGELKFMGLHWSTILAIAFCGIDFAGIARLFAPNMTKSHSENWFLFGAWMLAAIMNASLTWWGVSLAILNHQTSGSAVISQETMLRVVPVFVAILVWLIRVLIIGAFSLAGEQLFNNERAANSTTQTLYRPVARPNSAVRPAGAPRMASGPSARPALNEGATQRNSLPPLNRPANSSAPVAARQPSPAPHAYNNKPQRYIQPEPDYEDGDDMLGGEILTPRYAPLAAQSSRPGRSKAQRSDDSPAALPEPGSSRSKSGTRQF